MARQSINTGTLPNDGTGDPGKSALDKTEANFLELYNRFENNSRVIWVGPSHQKETIKEAVDGIALSDLIKEKTGYNGEGTVSLTFTNGSTAVTGLWLNLDGNNNGGKGVAIGDLLTNDGTNFYKIKAIDALASSAQLHEPYRGGTTTNATWKAHYLDRVTIFILPGDFKGGDPDVSGAISLKPGIDIVAIDPFNSNIVEGPNQFPNGPFQNFSDNKLYGLRLGPHVDYGSLDGIVDQASELWPQAWAGSEIEFYDCIIELRNGDNAHSGNRLRMPVIHGGRTRMTGGKLLIEGYPSFFTGGLYTPTAQSETVVNFDNVSMERVQGLDTKDTLNGAGLISLKATEVLVPLTVNINNCPMVLPDFAIDNMVQGDYIRAVNVERNDCKINISPANIQSENTDAALNIIQTGIYCDATGSEINIYGGGIIVKGDSATGIKCNAGTVNIHNCIIEGDTESLNQTGSGSIILFKGVHKVGPIGGIGVSEKFRGIATLVAGTKTPVTDVVEADSIILLSRMTTGGTLGHLAVTAIIPGVGFTITSSSATETSDIAWEIIF